MHKISQDVEGTPGQRRTWALIGLPSYRVVAATPHQPRPAPNWPPGTSFWVRLTASLSSYTAKPGMPVHAFLLESPECDNGPVFPTKALIEGQSPVCAPGRAGAAARNGGTGDCIYPDCPPGANPIEINGQVRLVDNARKTLNTVSSAVFAVPIRRKVASVAD